MAKAAVRRGARAVARKKPVKKKIFSVYLRPEIYEALKELHGRETSQIIGDLIEAYLEEKGVKAAPGA